MRLALSARGLSADSVDMVLRAHRVSSTRQYQAIWSKFLSFLSSKGLGSQDVSIAVVCDFLTVQSHILGFQYRTVAAYRCALRHPLLFACGLDINCELSVLFMRGVFNFRPPRKASPMPVWSLSGLLCFLCSDLFEPLEEASILRLSQKTLFLLLLASGRRISEVAHISGRVVPKSGALSLLWVPDFRPKHFSPSFRPCPPSISPICSSKSRDVLLCPVRAFRIYKDRSSVWLEDVPLLPRLRSPIWSLPGQVLPSPVKTLSSWFISLVKDCRSRDGLPTDISVGPHQMRKFAASYSLHLGHDTEVVRKKMGFSSLSILKKNYLGPSVPPLLMPCVLPGGSHIPPRVDDLSESD